MTSQAFRYRRASTPEERQQSRILVWALAFAFTAAVAFGLITWLLDALGSAGRSVEDLQRVVFLVFPLVFAVIPITLFVVLVRYRLWDIDKVINKALVYATLAAFISAVYVAIVVGIGVLVGSRGEPNVGLSILATAVVALAFQPVRDRVQRLANRLVYGKRATPYEVLSRFSHGMASGYAAEEIPSRVARILGEGTGARRAEVWLRVGSELRRAGSWPDQPDDGTTATPGSLSVAEGEVPEIPGVSRTAEVRHDGELLGALAVTKAPSDPLTPDQDNLVSDLASQAALVLRNVRLTTELRARLEEISNQANELQASRKRLVAAQDEERRRLERNIHDGAQQQLVALSVKLGLAKVLVDRDPRETKHVLADLQADSLETLENLRDLARGIYPPVLADQGLEAALAAQARKSPLPLEIQADGIPRYSQETEAAVYFCCLEALQNVAKYANASRATITLAQQDGELSFSVTDDGKGFDPKTTPKGSGLQNMADRIAAIGGELEVRSKPGEGTTVIGRVPARALEVAG